MSKSDNPASRLIAILEKAHLVLRDRGSMPARAGWAYVFEIPTNGNSLTTEDGIELIYRLIQFIKLIDETEQALRTIEGVNLNRYLAPFPAIRSVISLTGLDQAFIPNNVTDTHMVILGFCEDKLEEYHLEPKIEEEEIKALIDDINNLYEEVKASAINQQLRVLILEQLEHMRRAIHEYHIRGAERLREEMTIIVGTYILNKDLVEEESSKEEVNKFKNILSRFASVVAFASHATRLIEAASTYLPKLLHK